MSRSRKKNPCWSICGCKSANYDKTMARRSVRRTNNQLLKKTVDFEEYSPLHRLECSHNDVWSWNRDGNQIWNSEKDFEPEMIIEIDIVTQVTRVLDGFPAINPSYDHKEHFRRMMRK